MAYIYYLLVCVAHIVCLPLLFLLSFKTKYKDSIKARFFTPINRSKESYTYWLHACSFGEVSSLIAIIDSIPKDKRVFLSVITNTGFNRAVELFGNKDNVAIGYLPFESLLPFVAPKCENLFVFEAEIWLMLFFHAKRHNAKTKLINARISKRSFKRYLAFRWFYSHVFLFVDSILSQSRRDSFRLQKLGGKNIKDIGNIKALNKITHRKAYKKPSRMIILAASTHNKEEEIILRAFSELDSINQATNNKNKQIDCFGSTSRNDGSIAASLQGGIAEACSKANPNLQIHNTENTNSKSQTNNNTETTFTPHNKLDSPHFNLTYNNPLLIVVPRHPERFELVYNLCTRFYKTTRWSNLKNKDQENIDIENIDIESIESKILLIDSMGELINLYAISDIVILAGSFMKIGGHNPLEPAHFNNVIISGKEIFNQNALFSMVRNYYLVDSNELGKILKSKSLAKSSIDKSRQEAMLDSIFST